MQTLRHELPNAPDTSGSSPDGELAGEVVDQTLRLAAHLRGRLHDALAAAGVNESRFAVLRHVASRGQSGCSQVELADAMGQCESSICTLIERMRADGLVVRQRCTIDRRRSRLHLTDDGALALAAARKASAALWESLATLWGSGTLDPLRQTLESMLFELERPAATQSLREAA